MKSSPRERARRFSLLLVGISLGLSLAEIGLRILGFSAISVDTRDPVRGWAFRPGAEGLWRREGEAAVRINSQGYRDREHNFSKPHKTLRVAVLGDSFTAGLEVPLEKTFCSVLEKDVAGCPALGAMNVEVLNFGVGGYGTAQELLTLRQHVWKYEPDIVILSFYENDIYNNHRTLNQEPSLGETAGCPYFVYRGERLVEDDSFRSSAQLRPGYLRWHNFLADLMNRCRILQLLNKVKHQAISRMRRSRDQARAADPSRLAQVFGCAENQPCKMEKLVDEEGLSLDSLTYYPPEAEAWKEAWRVTEGLIVLMRDEVRQHGAQFWIMIDTMGMQVNPDPAVRQAFMKKLGLETLHYPDERLRALAERENIPVVALATPMAAYAESHHVYLHGFKGTLGAGHWNETGHRVAGEILAARLCASMTGARTRSQHAP